MRHEERKRLRRRKDNERSREFWRNVDEASETVASWPWWKRGDRRPNPDFHARVTWEEYKADPKWVMLLARHGRVEVVGETEEEYMVMSCPYIPEEDEEAHRVIPGEHYDDFGAPVLCESCGLGVPMRRQWRGQWLCVGCFEDGVERVVEGMNWRPSNARQRR